MYKTKLEGRRHTKRLVTTHQSGGETIEMPSTRVSLSDLPKLKNEALEIIRTAHIPPEIYLRNSPCGSLLRDRVINFEGHPPDSIQGLAARIYEHAAHVEAYRALNAVDHAIDMMAKLAELVTLFDIYKKESQATSDAGKKSIKSRPVSKVQKILETADKLLKAGHEEHEIAGITASTCKVTSSYVRQVLKKKRN